MIEKKQLTETILSGIYHYTMKKLLLMFLFLPSFAFAQAPKGYGFIGAGMHFIKKDVDNANIAGRFNVGIMPTKNAGIGLDIQFIHSYGVPLLADFRFISPHIKSSRLTIAMKLGTNLYDKSGVKGGFTYGAEGGIILGKSNSGFYISAQYLNIQYRALNLTSTVNDFGFTIGAKF